MRSQFETQEGESWNFDTWIIKHQLSEAKELFIKHNATTSSTLKLTSPQFQSMMTDPALFSKSHIIPKIMNAMQNMSAESIVTVVIDDDEQNIIDTIQSNIQTVNKFEIDSNKLKSDLSKSKLKINNERLQKTEPLKIKINKIFNDLTLAVKKKKEEILNQIDNMQQINDDDEKKVDIISETQNKINYLRQFLQQQSQNCKQLISTSKDRKNRKQQMVKIGNNVNNEYDKTIRILNDNIVRINKRINNNNYSVIDIDFAVDNDKYKQALQCINNVGVISDKTYIGKESNFIFHSKGVGFVNYNIADNGLSVTSANGTYVSVQFGDFFSTKNKSIFFVKFNMKTIHPNLSGIGFITKTFDDFIRGDYNYGGNDSLCCYGNGYFVTSKCFDANMVNHKSMNCAINYAQGHDIMVKIDTNKMEAIIWNYTCTMLKDINIDNIGQR
eukprot:551126_1